MRQLGRCAYCKTVLSDAMQTDHMDEDRTHDAWDNLACACGTCHANKSHHFRLKRHSLLEAMLQDARRHKAEWDTQWADEGVDHYAALPGWLQSRVSRSDARSHHARRRASAHPVADLDLEKYRYKPSA